MRCRLGAIQIRPFASEGPHLDLPTQLSRDRSHSLYGNWVRMRRPRGDVALTELGFNRDPERATTFPLLDPSRRQPGSVGSVLFHQFSSFAASRGEGLHPKLHALLERAAASPVSVLSMRHDGLIQAGPDPDAETALLRANVVLLPVTKWSFSGDGLAASYLWIAITGNDHDLHYICICSRDRSRRMDQLFSLGMFLLPRKVR